MDPSDAKCLQCKTTMRSVLNTCVSFDYFNCPHCNLAVSVHEGKLVEYISSDENEEYTAIIPTQPFVKKGKFAVVKELTDKELALATFLLENSAHGDLAVKYNWYCYSIRSTDLFSLNDSE